MEDNLLNSIKRETFAKSDDLKYLLTWFENPAIKSLFNFVKIKIIVDANIVLNDIKWILTKAKSSEARTDLLEVLEAGSIECFAPTFLDKEVKDKLSTLSARYDFDIKLALQLWERFKSNIELIEVGEASANLNLRDPKDWPYIQLQKIIEVPIVSKDKDIAGMGGHVVHYTVLVNLRNYARNSATCLKLIASGGFAAFIPLRAVFELFKLLRIHLFSKLPKPPKWLWVLVLGIIFVLVILPFTRTMLINYFSRATEKIVKKIESALELLEPVIQKYKEAELKSLSEIDSASQKLQTEAS
jgi:predicted nucleic acid-binding protein